MAVTIVAVVKQYYISSSVCLQPQLTSMQSACAILYCRLRPVWLHLIFPHYLITGTISEEHYCSSNACFVFSTTFVWNTAHCRKNSARYCHKFRI